MVSHRSDDNMSSSLFSSFAIFSLQGLNCDSDVLSQEASGSERGSEVERLA